MRNNKEKIKTELHQIWKLHLIPRCKIFLKRHSFGRASSVSPEILRKLCPPPTPHKIYTPGYKVARNPTETMPTHKISTPGNQVKIPYPTQCLMEGLDGRPPKNQILAIAIKNYAKVDFAWFLYFVPNNFSKLFPSRQLHVQR